MFTAPDFLQSLTFRPATVARFPIFTLHPGQHKPHTQRRNNGGFVGTGL
ncbi:hypothetical protein PC114_g20341 [Phytophthora cactorum]|nr:hypothetical protein PC114_g20341 [Phytophthora cactorum]KAG3003581.1 hypothetical protein PC120_g19058 [Phytophthora cactorum]KAG3161391.1 hypothetical protein PC128_g20808 [Phytophthora cactorum]